MVAQDVGSAIEGPERGDVFRLRREAEVDRRRGQSASGDFFMLVPVFVPRRPPALPWQTTDQAGP